MPLARPAAAIALLAARAPFALAEPAVPGLSTSLYSALGPDVRPYTITLDDAGWLYAASDNNANEGVFILRVPPGGGAPSAFSTERIYDPDGVILDRTGSFSGVPGAILVGCTDLFQTVGRVRALRSDGTNFTVVGPSPALDNNDAMAFDSLGRLYIDVHGNRTIDRFEGTTPVVFASFPPGVAGGVIAIDHLDRLWVSCNDGALRRFSAAGVLEATIPVGPSSPGLGYSPGGLFPRGVYAVNLSTGALSRLNDQDQLEQVGAGFQDVYHLIFDPAGAMLAAEYLAGRIWKIGGCPADFNGDGFLDFFDYSDFVDCFETGACPPGRAADFSGDGFVDFFDYLDFVLAFEQGC